MKIITLNIEREKHLNRNIPFLQKENPDVVCLQEVPELNLQEIADKTGLKNYFYTKMFDKVGDKKLDEGLAIFTRFEILDKQKHSLADKKSEYKYYNNIRPPNFYFITIAVKVNEKVLNIGCTHFPATVEGAVTPLQVEVRENLLIVLKDYENIVFSGDFNAPRGRETFDKIAEIYTDNIPLNCTTTIDQNLHQVKNIQFVVDGLFSSKNLKVENVKLVDGVSDHQAVVAELVL